MNENDDVMGFDDEPEINPYDSYTEPDIPEEQTKSENQDISQSTEQNVYGDSYNESNAEAYAGYEDFEAMDSSDLYGGTELNAESYQESEKNESDNSAEQNEDNDGEVSQSKKILDTKPSEKTDPQQKKNKNKGLFLNRQKLLLIFAVIFVAFILFFTFIYPMISTKKQKEKESELDKNGRQYIPQVLNQEIYDYTQPEINNFEDGNSATNNYVEEPVEEKFPPLVQEQPKNVAPVSIPSSSSSTTEVPLTNRNEQQKQPQRLALEKTTSPVEAQNRKNGAYYPTVKPQGYNTGYNSGYSGTNTDAGSSGYTPQSLSNNIDRFLAQQSNGNLASSYYQQNNQSAKQDFLKKNGIGGQYQWNSEYSLWKGTVISAVLDTGINTDLPGQIMAHVTKNVYSSQNGEYLLIPQGSRLYGEYSSDISYGQNRIQVVWNTLIRPDGLEVNLGSMNGIDAYGMAGYAGWKSEHPFEYMKAFGLIAMYSIIDTKAMNLIDTQDNMYAQNAISDVYSETKKLNNKIVDRALDIQPTLRLLSGKEVNLITNVTIDLPPLEPYDVEQKYVRY